MSDFKPGFNWQDRTIKPRVPNGTRERDILIRLDEIHAIKMRDSQLPYDLAVENHNLINELNDIYKQKFADFISNKGCNHLWMSNTVSKQQTFRECVKCGAKEKVDITRKVLGGKG